MHYHGVQGSHDTVRREGGSVSAGEEDGLVDIDPEDFDPVGTVVLLALYFLVLMAMWGFMYLVEFLGNGPTITG